MELRAGYKQSEVGVIPEDWEVQKLFILSNEIGDGIHSTPNYVKHSDFYFINGNNLVDNKVRIFESTMCVNHLEFRMYRKNLGDRTLLLSINGTIGNLAFYNDEQVILGKSAAYINIKKDFSRRFVSYCLKSKLAFSYFENELTGTTIRNLSLQTLRNTPIPLPPTLLEQRAIATALSDVDALLDSLEQLIAKKRDLKQAAMQQLLTGQQRLEGFSEAWEVKTLGELFSFSGGFSASRDQLSDDGYCYLHYGDIHGSKKTFIDAELDYSNIPKLNISLKRISKSSLLEDGDVVFVDASEDDDGTSKHVVVKNSNGLPFISGLHTIIAKRKTFELTREYCCYCFQTAEIKRQFLFYAVGTKVSGISKSNITKLKISFPSLLEQQAIATILSDMDAEIAALETRRDKTKALKYGMMQELLTGKTRLV